LINKIIVIGGNAAGAAAAAKVKRYSPETEVLMIEASEYISSGTCELPYVISGEISNYKDLMLFTPETFEKEKRVKVLISHLVEKIDSVKKTIQVKNLKSHQIYEHEYSKLILCTGSNVRKIPGLPGSLSNVFKLKTIGDLIKIKNYIQQNEIRNILIIGAGYIGIESANAFKSLGYNVSILEKQNLPMSDLEDETRCLILDILKQNGIEFINDATQTRFNHDGHKFLSITIEGRRLEYDLVILATGFEPNNTLAISTKLKIGKSDAISVDRKLKTSDPNIYAAGDCIEIINRITGKPDYIPLATIAHHCGHIAGENAAGGNKVAQPFVKNIAVKIFNKSLTSVGLSTTEASAQRFQIDKVSAMTSNLVKVMPKSEQVFGKIIYDKSSKQILGANFLGNTEVVSYGNIISTMINNQIKIDKLAEVDFNYTPPLSPFINLLSILGRKIERDKS
jgi:NADPH-dependent 2,4-dienoyl-CoA reductase/sulfur reductase-like enzyme